MQILDCFQKSTKLFPYLVLQNFRLVDVFVILRSSKGAWRDSSVVKSVHHSSRGPKFNSQHQHQVASHCLQLQLLGGQTPLVSVDVCPHLHTDYTYFKMIKINK